MKALCALASALALSSAVLGQTPAAIDAQRLTHANDEPSQWMLEGRTYDGQRFSPLKQIDTQNVARLGLAWYADFDSNRGQEATPLEIDGVIYLSTAWSKV
jgi:quinohemoprotein ethanol dehydrogenase